MGRSDTKDYYALLGLEGNATHREIKKNYRRLATKFHPDKSSDPSTAAKFIAITEAYDVLSDRKSRAQYDLKRWERQKTAQEEWESFTTMTPPKVSLRTRRYIAQQKRSKAYHQTQGPLKQTFQLVIECLHIVSRYIIHVIGIVLFAVISSSAISQLGDAFALSYFRGVVVCLFLLMIASGIFRIAEHLYLEFKLDVEEFSRSYNLMTGKAGLFAMMVFGVVLLVFAAIFLV